MSRWRAVTRALSTSAMSLQQLGDALHVDHGTLDDWLREAIGRGLAERTAIGRYRLTLLGLDWTEGKVVLVRRCPGGHSWAATWLRALPRGVRMEHKEREHATS